MLQGAVQPHPARVVAAFAAAPVAAGIMFAALSTVVAPDPQWPFMPLAAFMVMIAAYITILAAVPAYFVLRRRVSPNPRNVLIVSAILGVAPGVATLVVNMQAEGKVLLDLILLCIMSALAGAAGGATFCLCALGRWSMASRRTIS